MTDANNAPENSADATAPGADPYDVPRPADSARSANPTAPSYAAPTGGWVSTAGQPGTTNTLSVISLVSSIASFVFLPFIGAVAGIITGHMALKQIKVTGESGRGLALWGTILGYVHIALSVLGLLAVLLFFLLAAGATAVGAGTMSQQQRIEQCREQSQNPAAGISADCQRLLDEAWR